MLKTLAHRPLTPPQPLAVPDAVSPPNSADAAWTTLVRGARASVNTDDAPAISVKARGKQPATGNSYKVCGHLFDWVNANLVTRVDP